MKGFRRIASFLLLLPIVACNEVVAPGQESWQSIQLDQRVVRAYTGFGMDLFGRLVTEAPDSNVFISPTSAAFALAMTYNGAVGETQAAMARVLGLDGLSLEEVNRANREWLAALENPGKKVELSLANSLWIRQGYPVHAAFLDRNRSFYRAEVQELDFANPAAVKSINDWVSKSTRGKIPQILDQIPGNVVLYLINALYFKGEWTHQFEKSRTQLAPFHLLDGTRKNVPMMRQEREFPYLEGDGFRMVSLPYGNGRFSMVLALPDESSDLASFSRTLTAERWEQWMSALAKKEVLVALPRFSLEWEKSLNATLKAMGMEITFGPEADFSAMSPRDPWIDEVKQKTILEVNEEGTVAAAVTSVAMVESARLIPELIFDRPFFLAIRDNATATLLFLGQVVDPS